MLLFQVPPNHGPHHGQSGYHHQEEDTGNSNPELAKYLDRSYWEQKKVESTSEGTRGRNSVPPASAPAQNTQHVSYDGSPNSQLWVRFPEWKKNIRISIDCKHFYRLLEGEIKQRVD